MSDHWPPPNLTPDPYISTDYRPGWAPPGLDPRRIMPRSDLQWFDRQWELTVSEPISPTRFRAWLRRVKEGDSAIIPIGTVIVAFVLIFGALILFGPRS